MRISYKKALNPNDPSPKQKKNPTSRTSWSKESLKKKNKEYFYSAMKPFYIMVETLEIECSKLRCYLTSKCEKASCQRKNNNNSRKFQGGLPEIAVAA